MKYGEALAFAIRSLSAASVPSPEADAHWLICYAAGISRSELLKRLSFDQELSEPESGRLRECLDLRVKRIPIQHITSSAGFLDFELEVGPGVFIPRPETESVVQLGIDYLSAIDSNPIALDIGAGSGAIAISLARAISSARVIAIELSPEAAEYTARNVAALAPRVELRVGDFQEKSLDLAGRVDLLISNPPYIPNHAVPIDQEVRDHDPELALYGGEDGLDVIREIIQLAPVLLKRGGMLVLEHADGQSDQVCQLLLATGFSKVQAHIDLAERFRSVSAIW